MQLQLSLYSMQLLSIRKPCRQPSRPLRLLRKAGLLLAHRAARRHLAADAASSSCCGRRPHRSLADQVQRELLRRPPVAQLQTMTMSALAAAAAAGRAGLCWMRITWRHARKRMTAMMTAARTVQRELVLVLELAGEEESVAL